MKSSLNSRTIWEHGVATELRRAVRHISVAFTLVELVVLIAIVLLLVAVTIPCLTSTNPGSKSAQCQANCKRLITAWQMYAYDNSDRLVVMLHGGLAQGGNFPASLGPSWCEGWLDWTMAPDNTNMNFLLNSQYARFANYLGQQPETFKCPADRYLSKSQLSRGWTQRARSYSGNIGIGQGNAEAGPWDNLYRHMTNIVDFLYPAPADTWVFIEEHPDSMNDPSFFSPSPTSFIDAPATYHNGACSFSFADGHAEMHRWVAALTAPRARTVTAQDGIYLNTALPGRPGDADLHWLSYHSPRRTSNSY